MKKEKVNILLLELKLFINLNKNKLKKLIISDEKYVKYIYYKKNNKKLDFTNPKTFNEKINTLKITDRNDFYSKLVDKYEVREYVSEKIGSKYLNQLYGVFDSVADIKLDNLPEKFVLKTTHDSGGVIICKDKAKVNWKLEFKKFKYRLKTNYYYLSREYHYKNVRPRIICERLLEDENLFDYKLFCFDGKVDFIQVDVDRFTNHTRNIYDKNWKLQDFGICYDKSNKVIEKPLNLDEMIECAEKLAQKIKFCRVDFYSVNNKLIFGEITFFPEAGLGKFIPNEYDQIIGDKLKI